jgi:hypothetical protein
MNLVKVTEVHAKNIQHFGIYVKISQSPIYWSPHSEREKTDGTIINPCLKDRDLSKREGPRKNTILSPRYVKISQAPKQAYLVLRVKNRQHKPHSML